MSAIPYYFQWLVTKKQDEADQHMVTELNVLLFLPLSVTLNISAVEGGLLSATRWPNQVRPERSLSRMRARSQ